MADKHCTDTLIGYCNNAIMSYPHTVLFLSMHDYVGQELS